MILAVLALSTASLCSRMGIVQHLFYLFALLFSLAGLLAIDFRFKIALGSDWRRGLKVLGTALVLFVIWDLTIVAFGIVTNGTSPYSLPFTILPEIPLEEVLFLVLLSYCILLIYAEAPRWRRTR